MGKDQRSTHKYLSIKLNVAVFISSLSIGGAEKQAVLDANLLSESRNVFLFTFESGPLQELISKKVNFIILEKKGYLSTAKKLGVLMKEKNIEILHASLFAPMIISCLASRHCNVSVIWHFHSQENDIPIKSKIAFRFFSRFRKLKKILFVNHDLAKHFDYLNFPPKKLGILYNHSEIESSDEKQRTETKVQIGYVGRVINLKRVDYLIDLAEYLIKKKSVAFNIQIVGDGETLQEIKKLVKDRLLSDFFLIHGFQTDVQAYYKNFNLFVNPSSEECLSIAMIDAGMMNLPIVAFNVGGNNEIVVNERSGFIVTSKEEFFEKIFLLTNNSDIRAAMSLHSKEHCQKKFSRENHFKEIEKIYAEIK